MQIRIVDVSKCDCSSVKLRKDVDLCCPLSGYFFKTSLHSPKFLASKFQDLYCALSSHNKYKKITLSNVNFLHHYLN